MSYLIYRQLWYPLGDWATKTLAVRNEYANTYGMPVRAALTDWTDLSR